MALTFASYAVPGSRWTHRIVALAAVARAHRSEPARHLPDRPPRPRARRALAARAADRRRRDRDGRPAPARRCRGGRSAFHGGVYGVLQAAGLLFFAFAGYARIATLGEEVLEPERTIPRAIPIALAITVVLYVRRRRRGARRGGAGAARGELRADRDGRQGGRLGLGAAGRARRRGDREPRCAARADHRDRPHGARDGAERRPAALARHCRPASAGAAPRRAGGRGAAVAILVLTTDLRGAIGFSSFGVLTYYAVANASAFTQDDRAPALAALR